MTYPQVISVEPSNIETRFSNEDSLEEKSTSYVRDFTIENIRPLLDKLPDMESDFIYLYFELNKKQSDIARIFGCTQAAVSYRIKKAVKRIKFLLSIPNIGEEQMRLDLSTILNKTDVDILVGMYNSTCQSWVAEQLGLSQGLVRHRFFKTIHLLKTNVDLHDPYYFIFSAISKNFNILKEVVLPQWNLNKANVLMPLD